MDILLSNLISKASLSNDIDNGYVLFSDGRRFDRCHRHLRNYGAGRRAQGCTKAVPQLPEKCSSRATVLLEGRLPSQKQTGNQHNYVEQSVFAKEFEITIL